MTQPRLGYAEAGFLFVVTKRILTTCHTMTRNAVKLMTATSRQ